MIKARKDNVRFEGSIQELCAELCVLIKHLRKCISAELSDQIAKDLILKVVELGLKNDEEINEKSFNKEGESNE